MARLSWIIAILVVIGAALSSLCQRNPKAQYYIKNFFFFWWYMGTAALVIPIALFRPGDSINMGWWAFWVKYTFTMWMFGVKLKKHNTEELEYDGPCVVVCNHQTAMDQVIILQVWPSGRNTIMAKKSLKYAGTMGIACMLSGLIFVDRFNTEKAKSQTKKECLQYLSEQKGKLWIYPEGTRTGNREEHMLPFKKGAFHIAVEAQVPIIPIVMSGYKNNYSDKLKKFGNSDVTLTVLPKISTEGLKSDDVSSLADRVRDSMLETYYKTTPHVERPTTAATEEVPLSQDELQVEKDMNTNEPTGEIETVRSKGHDLQEVENLGAAIDDKEQTKSENVVDSQSENSPHLGQVDENITSDENKAHNPADLSKPTLLVDLSDADNAKDSSLSTTKNENDDSPSSQASSDSFVIVDPSNLGNDDISPVDNEPSSEDIEISPDEPEKAKSVSLDSSLVEISPSETDAKIVGLDTNLVDVSPSESEAKSVSSSLVDISPSEMEAKSVTLDSDLVDISPSETEAKTVSTGPNLVDISPSETEAKSVSLDSNLVDISPSETEAKTVSLDTNLIDISPSEAEAKTVGADINLVDTSPSEPSTKDEETLENPVENVGNNTTDQQEHKEQSTIQQDTGADESRSNVADASSQ